MATDKTLVALTKNDPSIYVTIPISEDDCVGSSLPFINWNFKSIDISLSNLTFSAENYWNDAYTYIENNKSRWDELVASYEDLAIEFVDLLSSVEALSGNWLTPISMVYPVTGVDNTEETPTEIETWLNTNYPINPYGATEPYCYEYIAGQELYMFVIDGSSVRGLLFRVVGTAWDYISALDGGYES